jgi:hypothetical protein
MAGSAPVDRVLSAEKIVSEAKADPLKTKSPSFPQIAINRWDHEYIDE